jgi:hypothetical protein
MNSDCIASRTRSKSKIKRFNDLKKKEITKNNRRQLLNYLIELSTITQSTHEALLHTILIHDRVLHNVNVPLHRYQLYGMTCFLISCKCMDVVHPCLDTLVNFADNAFTKDEFKSTEWEILETLNYNVNPCSPLWFCENEKHVHEMEFMWFILHHYWFEKPSGDANDQKKTSASLARFYDSCRKKNSYPAITWPIESDAENLYNEFIKTLVFFFNKQ